MTKTRRFFSIFNFFISFERKATLGCGWYYLRQMEGGFLCFVCLRPPPLIVLALFVTVPSISSISEILAVESRVSM